MRAGKVGVEADGRGDIRQRAQRDQRQLAFVLAREAQQGGHGVLVFEAARQGRAVLEVAQPIAAVELGRVLPLLHQRPVDAGVDRHIAIHDLQDGQDIGIDLADVHIAGQRGDAEHIDGRVAKRQHDGLRVVHAGVGVNNQLHRQSAFDSVERCR